MKMYHLMRLTTKMTCHFKGGRKMSDQNDEEIIATKLDNGSMTVNDLLQHWEMKYGIPSWQIDYVKEKIK